MSASATGKAIGYSLFLSLFLLNVASTLQQPANAASLEIVSTHFSAGYMPVVGSYVEYEVRLTNTGEGMIEDQSLRVSLVSDSNRTHSAASYSVQMLGAGESKTLHLGPFKIEDEGRHELFAEMGGISLSYDPNSFTAYRQEAVQAVLIAIPLIAAGAGLTGFSLYRKKRAV